MRAVCLSQFRHDGPGKPLECSLDKVAFEIGRVIPRRCENNMKRLLILIVLVLAGCREQTVEEIIRQVNTTGTITDKQADILANGDAFMISLAGLTSITDKHAESLGKAKNLYLDGLSSITEPQAESLSKVQLTLNLNGLTKISNKQAESLGKVQILGLNGLTSITDPQAESLNKVNTIKLNGLTSITDQQSKSLRNVKILNLMGLVTITEAQAKHLSTVGLLQTSAACQPLIDKYKRQ